MPRFSGAELRRRRKALGLTIERLSLDAHTSYSTIMKLERDESRPSISTLERLCQALSCSPALLFVGDDGPDGRPSDLGTDVDAWVSTTLASAPPMSDEQVRKLSRLLFESAAAS